MNRRPFQRSLAAFAIVFGLASRVTALNPEKDLTQYTIDQWDTAQGLPQSSVLAILQTSDGYIWLGTQEGLARFDGVRFTVFDRSNTPQMSSTVVQALLEDGDGGLWVGTDGGGLLRYSGGVFRAYTSRDGLSDDGVTALARDRDGALWIGTAAGLTVWRGGRFAVYRTDQGLPGDRIRALHVDAKGTLWLGTDAGLARFDAGGFTTYGLAQGLPSEQVRAIAEDANSQLWVGTLKGAARLSSTRFVVQDERHGLPEAGIVCLYTDRAKTLWLGTASGHLVRHGGQRFESISSRDGLNVTNTTTLFEDREGSLWVGTSGSGLVRLKDSRLVTYSTRQGLPHPKIFTVAPARAGGLWLGMIRGGVGLFRDGRFSPLGGAQSFRVVRALREASEGLWIGTNDGLYLYRSGKVTVYSEPAELRGSIRAIVEDASGDLWVGTESGGIVRRQGGRFVRYGLKQGLPNERIRAIMLAQNGDLWIGTHGGLSRFRGGRLQTFTAADGLPSNVVKTIFEDGQGTLWVGTLSGISRLRNGRFTSYRSTDGLFADQVHQFLEDASGQLWMSSNKGIFRVSQADLDEFAGGRIGKIRSIAYDESDGMLTRECNSGAPAGLRTEDGKLWFPTLNGLVQVDPSALGINSHAPPVVLERIVVDDQDLDTARPAELAAGSRDLEFHYAGLSFVNPGRVSFRYMLEGFDTRWTDAGGRRVAFYTRVPPGRYRFLVSASNDDGVESLTAASFDFRLRPYWHQTFLFRTGAAIMLAVIAAVVYRQRVNRLEARETELTQRVQAALAKIRVLSGMLPICACCKKIRDDRGYWNQIESYVRAHSQAEFSHGICPDCAVALYPAYVKKTPS